MNSLDALATCLRSTGGYERPRKRRFSIGMFACSSLHLLTLSRWAVGLNNFGLLGHNEAAALRKVLDRNAWTCLHSHSKRRSGKDLLLGRSLRESWRNTIRQGRDGEAVRNRVVPVSAGGAEGARRTQVVEAGIEGCLREPTVGAKLAPAPHSVANVGVGHGGRGEG